MEGRSMKRIDRLILKAQKGRDGSGKPTDIAAAFEDAIRKRKELERKRADGLPCPTDTEILVARLSKLKDEGSGDKFTQELIAAHERALKYMQEVELPA